jgi:ribosomal protein S18 acetylase RimI-like enzyme
MPCPVDIVSPTGGQTEACAQVLAQAFQDDPLMVYALPNAQARARLLPGLLRIVVRYCQRYGAIYTTSGMEAVVCCLPPGQAPTIGRLALISLSGVPVRLGLMGLRRYLRASAHSDYAHKQAAPGAHWCIWALGVDPAHQGHGFGGRLVRTVLQQARTQRLPCYLDTENPRNVSFYQRHGFRQVSETAIAGSGVSVYAMVWEPEEFWQTNPVRGTLR